MIQFFCIKIFYDDYEIQKYCCLIDSFCQHVVTYNCQHENQMRIINNQINFFDYQKFLYQEFQKKNRVLREILIVLTYDISFFLCIRDVDY